MKYDSSNLPGLDGTRGSAAKKIIMAAVAVPWDCEIQAPWGLLQAKYGVHHHMVQTMDDGHGQVDQYPNVNTQMFDDYEDIGSAPADDPRTVHLRRVYGHNTMDVRLFKRTESQKVLGRATEDGIFVTSEGEIRFVAGAYLNRDSKGHIWPIDAETFERDYDLFPERAV